MTNSSIGYALNRRHDSLPLSRLDWTASPMSTKNGGRGFAPLPWLHWLAEPDWQRRYTVFNPFFATHRGRWLQRRPRLEWLEWLEPSSFRRQFCSPVNFNSVRRSIGREPLACRRELGSARARLRRGNGS